MSAHTPERRRAVSLWQPRTPHTHPNCIATHPTKLIDPLNLLFWTQICPPPPHTDSKGFYHHHLASCPCPCTYCLGHPHFHAVATQSRMPLHEPEAPVSMLDRVKVSAPSGQKGASCLQTCSILARSIPSPWGYFSWNCC